MAAFLLVRAHALFYFLAAALEALPFPFSSLPPREGLRVPLVVVVWRSPLLYFRGPLTMAGILFEDIFDVKDIDPEGKKFDRGKIWRGCLGEGANLLGDTPLGLSSTHFT